MSERISKTQRWLDLIALLLRNRKVPISVDEIMERIPAYAQQWVDGDEKAKASVRRSFERDKDELRTFGIPIESVSYSVNFGLEKVEGYRIQRTDFYLPYLRLLNEAEEGPRAISGLPSIELSPADAATALDALRRVAEIPSFPFADEARSALAKISFDIDADRFPPTPTVRVQPTDAEDVLEGLRCLSDALLRGKRVAFRYRGIQRDESTDRNIEPYGVFLHREWYVVGRDVDVDALRTFRVSRMQVPVVVNPRSPKERDFEAPADFDVREYVALRPWELGSDPPLTADLLFRFPRSLLAERNGEGELIETRADGSEVRRFSVIDPDPFLRWVLGMAGEVSILRPSELRDASHRLAEAVAGLYRDSNG